MSVKCKRCSTVWVLHQRKCPKCGLGPNGIEHRPGAPFSVRPPEPVQPLVLDTTPAPSADSYTVGVDQGGTDFSGGGGDFSGGGGGSDF